MTKIILPSCPQLAITLSLIWVINTCVVDVYAINDSFVRTVEINRLSGLQHMKSDVLAACNDLGGLHFYISMRIILYFDLNNLNI